MREFSGLAVVTSVITMVAGSVAIAQVGPDCVNASMNDIARHGMNTAGSLIGFSSGSVTCNHGDMPMAASPTASIRPLVGMNMYMYSDNGSFSRMQQLGQGWAKWVGVPINGTNAACGASCQGGGSGTMGVNCADVYSSGFNGATGMCARSKINPTLGTFTGSRGGGTDETNINTRVQVGVHELDGQSAGSHIFFETVDFLPDDAQYVRAGQTVAVNAMNNATSVELNLPNSTATPSMIGSAAIGVPAIARWAQLDPDVTITTVDHDDTPNPSPSFPGTFIRSRFYVASSATPMAGGLYRYEIAVFNLNSDRSCGSVTIPLPAAASMSGVSFSFPPSHSGEPFSNATWTWNRSGNALTIATDSFAINSNANAIRWGTMYNFGFTSNAAPASGSMTLGLFKPGTLASINASGLSLPGVTPCPADSDGNAAVDVNDLVLYLYRFEEGSALADLSNNGSAGEGVPDGGVDINDLVFYLVKYEGGC